jgi:hypothetical protein
VLPGSAEAKREGISMRAGSGWAMGVLLAALPIRAQEKNPAPLPPRGEDARIEAAIKKGVAYLRTRSGGRLQNSQELVLLALLHSGIKKGDPLVDELLRSMLEEPLRTTYRVALEAMILERLREASSRGRIFQCAQFLADNQCENGQWSYGQPTSYPDLAMPTSGGPPMEPKTSGNSGRAAPPDPASGSWPAEGPRIQVKKQREGPRSGDNSNSQYAAFGIRACRDFGFDLPKEVLEKAARWWRESQTGAPLGPAPGGVAPPIEPRGWSYGPPGNRPYGSMMAGAVAALTLYDYFLGVDWKKDEAAVAGVLWLRDNFSVADNPQRGRQHHYYFLYALERAGRIYGIEKLGKHDWYHEGAGYLLDSQGEDGSWGNPVDTCFALLFLRRATRPLIASVDPKSDR